MRARAKKALVAIVLAFVAEMSVAEDTVVLVVSSDSRLEDISLLDVRKAYLGISVVLEAGTIRPLRRKDDEQLNLIFLQSVIAMSEKSYERRLLSLMLKFGTPRPEEVATRGALLSRLERSPHAIAYMWQREAESDPRVKVIKVLWQDH